MFNTAVVISVILIVGLNLVFNFCWETLLNLTITFACVLLPSVIFLFLVRKFPKKWFDWKIFKVGNKELKFYDKIKIRKWKDKIPEYGGLVNFKKDKINGNIKDKNYVTKFIEETYYAEITHSMCIISAIIGFIFVPNNLKLIMGLPLLIAYIIFNIPSLMIQRHLRPRLLKMLNRLN